MTIGERIDSWIDSISLRWREIEAELLRKAMFVESANRACDDSCPVHGSKISDNVAIRRPPRYRQHQSSGVGNGQP